MNVFTRRAVPLALSLVLALAPLNALAQGKGHGKGNKGGKSHSQHWNPAPPKKNGRHDNRNWNKGGGYDDWSRRQQSGDVRYQSDPYRYRDDSRYRDDYRYRTGSTYDRRQQTKNEWRNLAIASGLVGVLGLLTKEPTLTFAGAAGALYSAYRYEQDRKSQSSLARARYFYFSQPYFVRDGSRYTRRTVTRDGQRYYQFVRG
jgi:hypothetical protein